VHVKGHIRELFEGFAEAGMFADEDTTLDTIVAVEGSRIGDVGSLLRSLWHSTDIMPSSLREDLRDSMDWEEEAYTYAQAAQRIYRELS
jgi:hypothetical protein